jgi:uncharacterized membrane protein YedE/YeeE
MVEGQGGRGLEDLSPHVVAALAALPIGMLFGAVVQRTNFCTMGAVSDVVLFGDWRRLRAWLLAIAVAMAGSQVLMAAGLIDLDESIYLGDRLFWAGALIGGLLFGIGMVFAGGCGSRNLVRMAAGDLRAFFVILILGISATMTLHGLTALARVGLESATAIELQSQGIDSQALPHMIAAIWGREVGDLPFGLALALAIAVFCLISATFRRSWRDIAGGLVVGLTVVAGWWATGVLAFDDFEPQPLASLTFVAPVGDSLIYLMTFTGDRVSFGVAAVAGILLGAFAMALARGEFRLQGFADKADVLRSLAGAFLMGFGGVTALGCTIGQGVTGLSTLSLGSFIAFGSLIAGGVLGVHLLDRFSE